MRIYEISTPSTLIGYHGSDKKYPMLKQGTSYLTSEPKVAQSYGPVISAYNISIRNPAILNGYGGNWDGFTSSNGIIIGNKQTTVGKVFLPDYELTDSDTVEFSTVVNAIHRKYPQVDGVICKDVIDNGANIEEPYPSNIYVIFNNNQAKFLK
jgi:hypothetical protein